MRGPASLASSCGRVVVVAVAAAVTSASASPLVVARRNDAVQGSRPAVGAANASRAADTFLPCTTTAGSLFAAAAAAAATAATAARVRVLSSSNMSAASTSNVSDGFARGSSPQTAFGEGVRVDAGTMDALALDIRGRETRDSSANVAARIRALRLIARVTLFVDYHEAVVAVPAVVEALKWCVVASGGHLRGCAQEDGAGAVDSEACAAALHCLADLAKEPAVCTALASDPAVSSGFVANINNSWWDSRV